MYIHDSVKTEKFNSDKKLNLLKNNIITISQFVNLIDISDPYTIIGPAIVDKEHITEFITEWKETTTRLQTLQDAFVQDVTIENIFNKLNDFVQIFPEINTLVNELQIKMSSPNSCPVCLRNKYLINIINEISKYYTDGRDLGSYSQFITDMINKYSPYNKGIMNATELNDFDINWLNPESFQGIGYDLIEGLNACFECVKKHLTRAKIFYEEWKLGYPEHSTLMYNSFIEANKTIEEGYVLFWDSLGQLDMASCELVGYEFSDLTSGFQAEIIELANKIRAARLLFQEDSNKVPNWNELRVEVQRLQNKIKQ
jgi:hypothetical protein